MKRVKVRKWRGFNNEWAIWCPCCADSWWPVYALPNHSHALALALALHHANTHRSHP